MSVNTTIRVQLGALWTVLEGLTGQSTDIAIIKDYISLREKNIKSHQHSKLNTEKTSLNSEILDEVCNPDNNNAPFPHGSHDAAYYGLEP